MDTTFLVIWFALVVGEPVPYAEQMKGFDRCMSRATNLFLEHRLLQAPRNHLSCHSREHLTKTPEGRVFLESIEAMPPVEDLIDVLRGLEADTTGVKIWLTPTTPSSLIDERQIRSF